MFAVNHWQLEQSGCLANDAVLCSMAALPAAAGTACPGNLGAAGLGLQGCCSRWWPWHGQCGVGSNLGCSRAVLLGQEAVPAP